MKAIKKNQLALIKQQPISINAMKQELIVFAETIGKENGLENKPSSVEEFNLFFGNKAKNTLQTAMHKNHEYYTPIAGMVLANEIRKGGAEKKQKLNAELSDTTLEKNQVEARRKPLFPDRRLSVIRKCIHVALVLLGVVEGIYAFKAFRSKGMDMLTSLSTGIGMAVAVCLGTHIMAKWCKNAPKKAVRFFRLVVSLTIPAILFYCIAMIRIDGYAAENQFKNLLPGQNKPSLSADALDLFLISYIFYLVGFFLSYFFAKTKEESEQGKEFNKLTDECNRLKVKVDGLREQITTIEETTHEKSKEALENLEKAIATERQIESIAPEVLQHYIDKNLRHRTDGIPVFYNHLPRLQFQKFFDNINTKNNNNEN
jgi:hypothetical protein